VYKPGTQNRVADALSRIPFVDSQLLAITTPHLELFKKIQEELRSNT
jgi:hypothetical protein